MRSAVLRSRRSWSCAAVFLAALLVVGCGNDKPVAHVAKVPGAKVGVVVFENHDVSKAAWLAAAAKHGGIATNAHGEQNPSMGNYLAMLSGSTQGVHGDPVTAGPFAAPSLAGQLTKAGVPWRAYFNAMPGPCYKPDATFDEFNRYAKRHNPFVFFSDVIGDRASCQEHVVPGNRLPGDIASGKLRSFVWLGPDICQDAHNCSVETAGRWMAQALPPLIRALGPKGVLFVTADESTADGNPVPMIALGPLAKPGATTDARVDHRALLATIQDLLGVGRLPATKDAPTLGSLLRG